MHESSIGAAARCAIALLAPVFSGLVMGQTENVIQVQYESFKVYAPVELVLGHDLDDWSAEWQKWYISIPASTNPALHNDISCSSAQSGPVWFLPSGVNKTCVVPPGKLLLLTLINTECSNVEAPPFFGTTEEARESCAESFIKDVGLRTLKLTIDGVPALNLSKYRTESPQYFFRMPATDNVLGVTSGATSGLSVSDGYFMFIHLAPGRHVLHAEAALVSGPFAGFSQITDYAFAQM